MQGDQLVQTVFDSTIGLAQPIHIGILLVGFILFSIVLGIVAYAGRKWREMTS